MAERLSRAAVVVVNVCSFSTSLTVTKCLITTIIIFSFVLTGSVTRLRLNSVAEKRTFSFWFPVKLSITTPLYFY